MLHFFFMKVSEIEHYFHGLAQIYLPGRVVWGITLAEDVLFKEVYIGIILIIVVVNFIIIIGYGYYFDGNIQCHLQRGSNMPPREKVPRKIDIIPISHLSIYISLLIKKELIIAF